MAREEPPRRCNGRGRGTPLWRSEMRQQFNDASRGPHRASADLFAEPRLSFEGRFWRLVQKTDGCWRWAGALHRNGYGKFGGGGKKGPTLLAHRVAWELASGQPVPPGFRVLHTCDDHGCVR